MLFVCEKECLCIYIQVHKYIHIRIYSVCICVCIHIYIYTHTQIYIPSAMKQCVEFRQCVHAGDTKMPCREPRALPLSQGSSEPVLFYFISSKDNLLN